MKTNVSLFKKFSALMLLIISMSSYAQTNVVGYFPTYENFPGEINNIDLAKLTHLNIAFANPDGSGAIVPAGVSNSDVTTVVNAAHAKNVKVLISIGGAGAPGNYYSAAFSNSTNMTNFVNTCVNYVTTYNLDGIDVDIEGDVLNGSQVTSSQYEAFVTQLGKALHAKNKIMTAAVADWFGSYVTNNAVAQFDFIGVMAYDENIPGTGDQPGTVGDYQFAVDNYNYWHAKGVPGSKINIGVPFYGYGWGTYAGNPGGDSYASIVAKYPGAQNSDQVGSGANAEYYNGIPTIKQKTAFAIQNGGGIMIWEVTQDATGSNSLLTAINQVVVANSNPVPNNLAKGKPSTASSTEVNTSVSTAANNATDGNYSTRWSSLFADPQWLYVDLGANYTINRVKITWETALGKNYQIQTSPDATNWTTVLTVTGNTSLVNDQTGVTGTGRYVRIYGTARGTVYGYSIYELEVYGSPIESPYTGTPISLPGTIQAENYDIGGEGLAYHDTDSINQGGAYRTDGVDIEATTDVGGGYDVGYIASGEWLKYTVNVATTGTYNIGFRTAATSASGVIQMEVDGNIVVGPTSLPNTGGWQNWTTITSSNISLTAGQHIIKLDFTTGGFNLNYVTVQQVLANLPPVISLTAPVSNASFTAPASITISANASDPDGTVSKVDFYNGTSLLGTVSVSPYSFNWTGVVAGSYVLSAKATDNAGAVTTSSVVNVTVMASPESPYGGTPIILPGQLQAENYDIGGEGIAYHDIDAVNQGGAYRTDGVDIEATTDIGGGYDVGYIATGEWLKYTVNITSTGKYNLGFRTAATSASGVIRMEVDGSDMTGPISLPNTSGWQNWSTTTISNISLTAGQHVIRLYIVAGGFNLNFVNFSIPLVANGPGFLHASGKNIVNTSGNFIIKAINIGNYMVQEGYMLNLNGSEHIFKQKIADIVGTANRDQFYTSYYQNYIVKADIDSIAKWGFNSIRLPMHYDLFTPLGQPGVYLPEGFMIVDSILSWCKANNLYLILDLHAAPGGENSGDISDYDSTQPSLWQSQANMDQTVQLWATLAARYANEEHIGGYDLLNETDWTLPNNTLLMQLMQNMTAAIRQVDNNHILSVEGNNYANDYTGLTPAWDNNMAYSFHKYWNDNIESSLNFAFAVRDGQNVPIWMGEFGENSNNWIANAVTLMNQNGIGWAIWPYKKMSSVSSISSFQQPSNWSALADYVNGGALPSQATGMAILNELLENIKVKNCAINKGYLYALFRQPGNTNTIPYTTPVSLPGKVIAANYDEGLNGYAYNNAAYQNTQYGSSIGSSTSWNMGWYYRNDGVDLEFSTAENGPTIGWTSNGDWTQYSVNVSTSGSYTISVRAAGNGGTISISMDGTMLINSFTIPATGGWDTWQTFTLGNVTLSAGSHELRATVNTGGYNLSYFGFTTQAVVNQPPTVSITSPANQAVFNAPATITLDVAASDVDGTVSKVAFYNGTTLLGTDNSSPYSFVWNNVAAGTYSVTAVATDNSNATTTSGAVTVVVNSVVTTNTCSGIAQYVENNGYVAGSVVQNAGGIYQCKPYPYTGWCNGAAWAYGPGTGTAWTDAWTQTGTCSNAKIGNLAPGNIYSISSSSVLMPNPTTGIVTIAVTNNVAVQVFNSYGQEVMSVGEVAPNGSVDISILPAGVYLFKLVSGEDIISQKIVKQ
jgi:GH18 family chitinase/aryl-phospho-beta-D-glucosidase BglC (GH1 family)